MLNLSSLFYSGTENPTLLARLDLTEAAREVITEAKTAVRMCLRAQLARVLVEQGHAADAVNPRFFTQGSWAYRTLNAPAQSPQQADIDDGAYLPLSFVAQSGKPSVASAAFFLAAEEALRPLVKARGWTLITSKDTCIRIEISVSAHIDIPLYAIPDGEFETLQKAARTAYDSLEFNEAERRAERDAWTALPTDSVLLAHRKENWVKSDPRSIKTWFLNEVDRYGEQFRRSVRYLKAFRDWQWVSGGPSSILLMAAAAPLFEQRERRDDLALADLVQKMPAILRDGVYNPVDPQESLTDRLGKSAVEEAAAKLETFEGYLRGALRTNNPDQACRWLIDQFGNRFPLEPSRVKDVTVAATVLATPAVAVASPLVGRQKSG